jgi:hypothetical protein
MPSLDDLKASIELTGAAIRELKGAGADKAALQPHIDELLMLKEAFKNANGGVSYDAPAEGKSKDKSKSKAEKKDAPQPEKEGPSKNVSRFRRQLACRDITGLTAAVCTLQDLKKLEKKARRTEAKDKARQTAPAEKPGPPPPAPTSGTSGGPTAAAAPHPIFARPDTIERDTLFFSPGA